ncbi:MAG: hypothetical protein L6Q75_19595 [Burkholderiaceae bacterium]|nr:hypothetical protein [Burkholderiaceae bacterium]
MGTLHRLDRGRPPRKWEGPAPIWQSAGALRKNAHPDFASAAADSQLAALQARFAAAGMALDPLGDGCMLAQLHTLHAVLRTTAEAWDLLRAVERQQRGRVAR